MLTLALEYLLVKNNNYNIGFRSALRKTVFSFQSLSNELVSAMSTRSTLLPEVDKMSQETVPPTNQPDFITLYDDLRTGFQNYITNDPGGTMIKISERTFRVCWTKSDIHEHIAIWGEIEIEGNTLDLMTVESRGDKKRHQVVQLGIMDKFPFTKALVYYSYADDMLYYYPCEAFSVDPRRPQLRVYPYRQLGELVKEFA